MANFTAEQYDTLQEILKVLTEARQISERWSESWAKGLANPIGPHTTHLSSPITPMTPSQSPQPPDPPDFLLVDPEPLVETMKNSGPFIESLKSASVLQVPDSFCEVLLVHKVDSRVKEGEESSQQLTSGNGERVAHQMFDQMPLRKASKEKQQTEALRSELNRMLAELKAMTANREATMPKFFSHTSILPRPPSQPPDPPDVFLPLMSELMSLKQHDDSVEMYLVKFERALSRLSLPVAHVLNIFLTNMSSHLALHVRQFDVTTVSDAAWIAKRFESSLINTPAIQPRAPFNPYQTQNNQSHYNSPNTTSLLPPLETTKTLPYKPNFPTETNMKKSCLKLSCEVIQESGMRGLCMSPDGSYANGHHVESKSQIFVMECEDATMSGGETNVETKSLLEKKTIPSSVLCDQVPATQSQDNNVIQQEELVHDTETTMEISPIQEPEPLELADSIFEVDFVHSQEFPSQCQVPIPSLEPSRRCQKESLDVINDLSCDLGCVIGKINGSICDSESGQDNSLDKEEFVGLVGTEEELSDRLSLANYVWKPGGISIELDKCKWSEKCYELSRVVRLMQGLSSTRWSYGKVAELTQELQQPKTYLKEIKLKELDRLVTCSSVGCIVALLMVYDAERIQSEGPPIFSDLLCVKNRIQGRLKMVLLLEFLWLTLFTSKMSKSSNVHQNNNQTDQKLSSYWKLLLRLLHPLHSDRWGNFCLLVIKPLFKGKEESVSFNVAVTSCSSYVKVLELIKDRDSRKRKLGKNWWFKFKLNTLPSETLHLWRKRKSEKLQRASKHMLCELVQNSWDVSIFGKSRTWLLCKMRILHDLKDLRQFTRAGIKFHLKHKWRSKFGSSKLTRTWTRQKAWPRVLPRLHVRAFNLSFLRTRMFSTGEYCDRVYLNHTTLIYFYL